MGNLHVCSRELFPTIPQSLEEVLTGFYNFLCYYFSLAAGRLLYVQYPLKISYNILILRPRRLLLPCRFHNISLSNPNLWAQCRYLVMATSQSGYTSKPYLPRGYPKP